MYLCSWEIFVCSFLVLSLPSLCRLQLCDIRLLELVPQLADVLVFCSAFFPLCFILDTFCCYIFKFTNLLSCDICGCCLVAKLCLTLCDPMDCSTPAFPVLQYLPELAQTHVLWVDDTIQPSHPLSPPSPSAFNLSQNQGLFQGVGFLHQVDKVLELQLQHQSFQWIFRVDF